MKLNRKWLHEEFVDRFGKIPKCVYGLVSVSLIRSSGADSGIYEITEKAGSILFYSDRFDDKAVISAIRESRRRLLYSSKGKCYWNS